MHVSRSPALAAIGAIAFLVTVGSCVGREKTADQVGPQMTAASGPTMAVCEVHPLGDSDVKGTVTFTEVQDGVRVHAELTGLKPGEHGFHVHQYGDCTAADGKCAGGHFNPTGAPHGGPNSPAGERHVGAERAGLDHRPLDHRPRGPRRPGEPAIWQRRPAHRLRRDRHRRSGDALGDREQDTGNRTCSLSLWERAGCFDSRLNWMPCGITASLRSDPTAKPGADSYPTCPWCVVDAALRRCRATHPA
jgi:hypothetical protein